MSKVDFRYRRYGYTAFNVTDIDKTTAFATDVFGLTESGVGPKGERYFRATPNHHDIVLYQSDTAAYVRSGWELETDEDLSKAYQHYETIGLSPRWVQQEEAKALGVERAFRVREPVYGIEFEYYAQMTYITVPLTRNFTSFYGHGHVGISMPNPKKATDFLTENMGFMVSDYMEGHMASLLRAFPNPNHHSFAPLPSFNGKLEFMHVAFMVNSIDDIGKLFNRAKKYDVKIQFGMGRHPTSGSIHLYLYDPDFFVWEYTLGMEQFPEVGARPPRRMSTAPENFDLWGAIPDKEYAGRAPGIITG